MIFRTNNRELEDGYMKETVNVDNTAADLYKKNPSEAVKYLTAYSIKSGNNTVTKWKELYKFLFTKYLDGNVKEKQPVPQGYNRVNPKLSQPGYSEEWYQCNC